MNAFLDWLISWSTPLQFLLLGVIVVGAVLTGLTTIAGIVSSQRQAEKILALQDDLAKSKTKQTESEIKLEELKKKQAPRGLNMEAFGKALKGKPRCEVEILYQPNDEEAFGLANAISLGFAWADFGSADKFPPSPMPIPEDSVQVPFFPLGTPDSLKDSMKHSAAELSKKLPLVMRAGALGLPSKSGVFVASNKNRNHLTL